MPKTLNPHAAGTARPSAATPPAAARAETPRRNVVAAIAAAVIGGLVGLVPFASGLAVFLDPVLKRKQSSGGEGGRPMRRVASLAALPEDGKPVQVPVIADLSDAWSCEPNQPVGAVYVRKTSTGVEAFNAICPHAGCFVAYSAGRDCFQCPCHTSSFQLTGERILPSPSPRDMDALEVDEAKLREGEVWVRFVNYYPGKEHREEKA
jgi:menaquinol-cytochrome c reductase iron-sulfur subunit